MKAKDIFFVRINLIDILLMKIKVKGYFDNEDKGEDVAIDKEDEGVTSDANPVTKLCLNIYLL